MPPDLARQLPHVRRLFEALRTPVIEVPGFEADDVLGTLVERVADRDLDVVIVTGDKDLLQIVGPGVSVLSVVGRGGERVVYDAAKVRERWGVDPAQIPDVLALMGDSRDDRRARRVSRPGAAPRPGGGRLDGGTPAARSPTSRIRALPPRRGRRLPAAREPGRRGRARLTLVRRARADHPRREARDRVDA